MRIFQGWSSVVRVAGSAAVAAVLALNHGVALAEMATVRVGITDSSSDAPFFIADKRGYFKQEGLNMVFTSFNSAAKMIVPLGAGQLDVGGGTPSAGLYNAVARGIGVKIVADKGSNAPGYDYSSLLIRKDLVDSGAVKSFADLKGLRIAIGEEGTGTASAVNEALKKGGLKYSDAQIVTMGFSQQVFAFTNRAIDAGIITEPSRTEAVRTGAAVFFEPNNTYYPNRQVSVVLYGDDFIKNRAAIAKKFMLAYVKAARYYNDALKDGKLAGPNANEIISILTEYTHIKDPGVYRSATPSGCNPDGKVNAAGLKKDFQFFKEQGLIQGSVSVEQVLDSSFAEAAVKVLGSYSRGRQ